LTHACIPFFALTDVGRWCARQPGWARWVEPVCRDGRLGLPLTIVRPGLPLYLLYIYIYIYIYASEEASCSTSSPETNGTTHALLARNVAPNSLLLHTNGFLQSPPVFQGCMVDG
jgi:hypothetical protein